MAPADPQHLEWMGLALEEARRALATEDVPIGAVVIGPDGAVLGSGRNEREALGDPTAHAEVVAIREAAARLRERAVRQGGTRRRLAARGLHPGGDAGAMRHVRRCDRAGEDPPRGVRRLG